LPADFAPAQRMLALWRRCPPTALAELGGPSFARAAQLLGPVLAGRLFRRLQRPRYAATRTISAEEYNTLFG
jgi:hypothetical protein